MIKTAIVTGASRGIGLRAAEALLEKGFCVTLCARNRNDAISDLEQAYKDAVCFVQADIADSDSRAKILHDTLNSFERLDVLINNAGVAPKTRKDMLEITEQDFDYVMDINLKGTYFLTQAAAKLMEKQGGGYIINTGSISADIVSLNRAEYCMSKAGVRMLTKLFAARLAPYNIGVFEVSPGVIETDMIASVKAKYDALAESGAIPAGRLGTPDDVAKIVLSIVSGALDYSSGTVIHCDGGLHIPSL